MPITEQGKGKALAALRERRNTRPKQINNADLRAGSDMHYYCIGCGHIAHVVPEGYFGRIKKLCDECQAMNDLGWLDE